MTLIPASVIVRTQDKADTLGRAIASLRAQTVPVQIVVVDSGSTDGTLEIAHRQADAVIELEPGTFTYGRSLNVGARAASAEVLFALSAHCVADREDWIERSLAHYDDPSVAGTCGLGFNPDGSPLVRPRPIEVADLLVKPHWGFSNHASSWRRAVWAEMPFDEVVSTCEDKDWMWRSMLSGWRFMADPDLVVDTSHRRSAGARALWRRVYGERRFIAARLDYDPRGFRGLVRSWWSEFPEESRYPHWARRFSPYRNVELVAGYTGERAGVTERGPATLSFSGAGDSRSARSGSTGGGRSSL